MRIRREATPMLSNEIDSRIRSLADDLAFGYRCRYKKDIINFAYTFYADGRPDLVVTGEEMLKADKDVISLARRFENWANGKEFATAGQANGYSTHASDILLSLSGESLDVNKDVDGNICVAYRRADVKDGIALVGMCGRGASFESACEDYLKQIRGKTLVFNAESPSRHEVKVLG